MEMMTVTQVSSTFDVSTRMLRYYEKIGLLASCRKEDYAYRIYDETAVRRLQLILILRKLRIPLKQISLILTDNDSATALEILRHSIADLDEELCALETIRSILQAFAESLTGKLQLKPCSTLLDDEELVRLSHVLHLSKHKFKEKQLVSNLDNASERLEKNISVRFVLLPPCTVAAYHVIGENPEETAGDVIDKFVRESKLYEAKPDARMFGFNHPNPSPDCAHHGYEFWVTIPDTMEVPAPLVKKAFQGGLYAAHTIDFPNFNEWSLLTNWVSASNDFCADYSPLGVEIMGGCLEEHLNWVYASHLGWPETNKIDGKLDLLCPIKAK